MSCVCCGVLDGFLDEAARKSRRVSVALSDVEDNVETLVLKKVLNYTLVGATLKITGSAPNLNFGIATRKHHPNSLVNTCRSDMTLA